MKKSITFCVTNDIISDRRMIRICHALQNNGYEVCLVGRQWSYSAALPEYSFKTHRISCRFNKGPWFYAEYNIRLFWYLKKHPSDVFGAVDYDTLKGVTRAAGSTGAKVVFDAHEWFEEVPELDGREKVKKYWKKIAHKGIPKTDLRYTVSEAIAEKLTAIYGHDFEVIRNIPPLVSEEPSSIRADIIAYIGVLNKGRGLEQMIKAMKKINAQLWLIGEGDIKSELLQLVSDEQLHERVIFKGFIPPDEVHDVLCQARIGINLLDGSSKSYKYSLANKFFDYVHAGVPQICMDFEEYRKLNQEHGVAVTINDLNQATLLYAFDHLLSDRNYWFTIHSNCLRARQEWCWQLEEKKLLALVESTL